MKKTTHSIFQKKCHALVQEMTSSIIYHGKIDHVETKLLKNWLYRDKVHLRPSSVRLVKLSKRFEGMAKGGHAVSGIDRMSLFKVLDQPISPSSNGRRGAEKEEQKNESIFTDHQAITFEGKCFQFSGTLEFGKRDAAVLALEKLGGFIPGGDALTRLVNYLVVGNLKKGARKRNGHRDKISKAINLNREAHCEIQIIRERDFVKAVLKTFQKIEIKEKPFVRTSFAY